MYVYPGKARIRKEGSVWIASRYGVHGVGPTIMEAYLSLTMVEWKIKEREHWTPPYVPNPFPMLPQPVWVSPHTGDPPPFRTWEVTCTSVPNWTTICSVGNEIVN